MWRWRGTGAPEPRAAADAGPAGAAAATAAAAAVAAAVAAPAPAAPAPAAPAGGGGARHGAAAGHAAGGEPARGDAGRRCYSHPAVIADLQARADGRELRHRHGRAGRQPQLAYEDDRQVHPHRNPISRATSEINCLRFQARRNSAAKRSA